MSRVRQEAIPEIVDEPESFEEEKESIAEYKPEHPALTALEAMRKQKTDHRDHLDEYVEVDPFEKK